MVITSATWALAAGFAVGALFLCLLFLIVIGREARIRRTAMEETATALLSAIQRAVPRDRAEGDKQHG